MSVLFYNLYKINKELKNKKSMKKYQWTQKQNIQFCFAKSTIYDQQFLSIYE